MRPCNDSDVVDAPAGVVTGGATVSAPTIASTVARIAGLLGRPLRRDGEGRWMDTGKGTRGLREGTRGRDTVGTTWPVLNVAPNSPMSRPCQWVTTATVVGGVGT